jgi:hypothetical protein
VVEQTPKLSGNMRETNPHDSMMTPGEAKKTIQDIHSSNVVFFLTKYRNDICN